ncbi:hypothetical protein HPB52_012378 [Rhipicephalus sanguineus]|uniref:C2H2-type domain-containing protein n=1 Tax=Rhipicephalus sanguineus TaxID=34632 RepID=A0A9D4YPG6_RHISA|nr:hypothetical protein HPB52_012378 [Rhipicephalus sanguineus]
MRDRLEQVVAAKPLALSDSSEDLTTGSVEDSPQKTSPTDVAAPLSQPPAPEEPPPEEPSRDLCLDLSSPSPSEARATSEAAEPLNLTLKPVRDVATGENEANSNDDQVIAAKSLVSLSELPPPQEEPLDLAVHAIDLSWRNSSRDGEPPNDDSLDAMDDAGEGSSDNCSENNHERPDRLHCPCCDAAFSTAAEVELHVGQLIDVPYRCHMCDRAFVQRSDCLAHLQSDHTGLHLPANIEHEVVAAHMKNDRLESNDDYTPRHIACVFCLRRYVSIDGLKRHVLSCHAGDHIACDICHQKLPSKSSMARHKRKHQDVPSSELGDSSEEEGKPNHKHSSKKLLLLAKQKRKAGETAEACNAETKSPHECGNGDLIQNLLGIQDSKIIDEMLMNPADSAARLLGVKQV